MTSSRSKLSKENQDLINSMTSMELFNYLDERDRDMYAKQIIPMMMLSKKLLNGIERKIINVFFN